MIGEKIKELRKRKGVTQKELANIMGLEHTSISKYESNSAVPSDDVKAHLAEYFGVSIDYLLDLTDEPLRATGNNATATDTELLSAFRSLNEQGRKLVLDYVHMIASNPAFTEDTLSELAM